MEYNQNVLVVIFLNIFNIILLGYSLEEIFLLIRSSIPSQRTINIQILSKIIKKADSNQFLIYG